MFKLSTASSVVVSSESCGESTAGGSPEEEEEEEEEEKVSAAVKTRQLRRILHTLFCSPSTLLRGKETSEKSLLDFLLEAWSPSPCGNRKREAEEQQQQLLLFSHPLMRTCMGLPSVRMKFSTFLSLFQGGRKLRTIATETTMRKSKTSRARREKKNTTTTTTTTGIKKSGFKELPQFWNQARVRV
jgi:hypothetical protein